MKTVEQQQEETEIVICEAIYNLESARDAALYGGSNEDRQSHILRALDLMNGIPTPAIDRLIAEEDAIIASRPRWHRLKHWAGLVRTTIFGRRCDVCKGTYWRGVNEYVCSEQCQSKWFPF